jgi:hypothetical protein
MTTFNLTEEHLLLLRNTYLSWNNCETGAPEINPKRPYGNSYVPGDIHEILTGEDEELSEDQENEYLKLHKETFIALKILLQTADIPLGPYTLIGSKWIKNAEISESCDYLIKEWFNLDELESRFGIVDASTKEFINEKLTNLKTFKEAKEIITKIRRQNKTVYHSV